jgi:polyhydroxybutyrate depolymerase
MHVGRTRKLAIGLFVVAALGTAACEPIAAPGGGCIDSTAPGVRVLPAARCNLDITISVPPSCPAGGCGLIVDVHGFAMDANIQDRNTNLRRLGNQAGFVVAQPTAPIAASGLPSFSTQRDAGVLAIFARQAILAFGLNPSRIHIGGFSQGGAITFFSICNHADLYASAAPIAAGGGAGCFQNGPPIPFLQTNGVNDQFANFEGASATRSQVVAGMGLTLEGGMSLRSFPGITQTRFQNARGQLYEFIQHDFVGASAGAGHCFPGSFETTLGMVGPGVGALRFACTDAQQLRIGEAIVQFYQANPKR